MKLKTYYAQNQDFSVSKLSQYIGAQRRHYQLIV